MAFNGLPLKTTDLAGIEYVEYRLTRCLFLYIIQIFIFPQLEIIAGAKLDNIKDLIEKHQ